MLPLVLPIACLGCDELIGGGSHRFGLCARCRGRLRPLAGDRCPGCGRPLRASHLPDGYRCGACRLRPCAPDRLIALWVYRPPLDAVVHGLKFQRLEALGRQLALELARHLRAHGPVADAVVWVPLHWRRLLGRGYNQAERIARPMARALGLPALRALVRTRATPAQTGLERDRRSANLRGAIRARRRAPIAGRRLLLVDDVVTTGATLEAAAEALRRSGAADVTGVTVARTPGIDEPGARKTVIW